MATGGGGGGGGGGYSPLVDERRGVIIANFDDSNEYSFPKQYGLACFALRSHFNFCIHLFMYVVLGRCDNGTVV